MVQITNFMHPTEVSKTSFGIVNNREWIIKTREGLISKYGIESNFEIRIADGMIALFGNIPKVEAAH